MMGNIALQDTKEKRTSKIEEIVFKCVFVLSVISITLMSKDFIFGTSWLPIKEMSEFTLAFIHCILGMIVLFIPRIILKVAGIKLPNMMCSYYYVFVFCATILGEVFSLYYLVPIWDSLLHFTSGILIGIFGAILITIILQKKNCEKLITPKGIAIAVMFFTLCLGLVWEIYEFSADSLLGLNMQKFMLQDGTELIGQIALVDTMKDLITDSLGALVAAISSYFSLKRKRGWLSSYIPFEPCETSLEFGLEKNTLANTL